MLYFERIKTEDLDTLVEEPLLLPTEPRPLPEQSRPLPELDDSLPTEPEEDRVPRDGLEYLDIVYSQADGSRLVESFFGRPFVCFTSGS